MQKFVGRGKEEREERERAGSFQGEIAQRAQQTAQLIFRITHDHEVARRWARVAPPGWGPALTHPLYAALGDGLSPSASSHHSIRGIVARLSTPSPNIQSRRAAFRGVAMSRPCATASPSAPPPSLQAARAASEPSSTVASARKRPAASVHAPLGLRPSRWLVALASSLVRAPTPRVRRAPHALSPLSARLRSVAPSAPTASAAMRE